MSLGTKDEARKTLDAGLERLEHVDGRPYLGLGADQCSMPAVGGDDAPDVGGTSVSGR
jgi:hypothetical protein